MSKRQPKDERGGHVRLYWKLYDSPAFHALTPTDVRVWLAMRRRLGPTNNGDLSFTLNDARHAGISSTSTLARALRALETLGFIAKTRQGSIAGGGKRTCSLYRFTDERVYAMGKVPCAAMPATNDWERFPTAAAARAAIEQAHDAARRPVGENEVKLRSSKRADSKFEARGLDHDSNFEQRDGRTIRISKLAEHHEIGRQPAPMLAVSGEKA